MKFFDRLLTIVITATLTSIVWIIFGGTLLEMANERQGELEPEPTATTAPPTPSAPPIMEEAPPQPTPAAGPPPAPAPAGPGEPAARPVMPPVAAPSGTATPQTDTN